AFLKDKTGTENYSHELIKTILDLPEAKKHEFRLYVRGSHEGYEPSCRNVEVVEIGWKRLWTQGGLALEGLMRPVDVLWIPAHTLPIVRWPKLKTVVTIHGLEYEYLPEYYDWRKKWYLNKSTEYAVRRADKIIAVSKWTKSQLVDRLGADEKKIKVIYEGVGERFMKEGLTNLKHKRQVRYKYGLPENYILFVGTIQPRKNLVRLIKAFSLLFSGLSTNSSPQRSGLKGVPSRTDLNHRTDPTQKTVMNLIIAGKEGWMTDEIYEAPKKYGVEDRVKFIGRVADEDLAMVYKEATLFVWPSLMEGFGLPVLEAMQMGVPVITSDRGALPEVVGKAGLLIDPENVNELSKAIELGLKSRELRQGLREKGYKQVKKFSWEKAAKQTLSVLLKTNG
ncbi:MAG: glycosyltransferase family 1 protein, partial [Patescibacteria group bacterium]|nr:glycosyltransferase family 1 protein [Patescibacteria group bacterium]